MHVCVCVCWRNWHWDEPSCGYEVCVVMYHQPSAPASLGGLYMFQWNDDNCETKNNFICKYTAGITATQCHHVILTEEKTFSKRDVFSAQRNLRAPPPPAPPTPIKLVSRERTPSFAVATNLHHLIFVSLFFSNHRCVLHICVAVESRKERWESNSRSADRRHCHPSEHEIHWTINTHISSLRFSALNLFYIIIPTILLIVLLLTVTGVCCLKLLARRWATQMCSTCYEWRQPS